MDNNTESESAATRGALLAAIARLQDAQSALNNEVARIRVSLPEYVAFVEARSEVIRLRALHDEAVAVAAGVRIKDFGTG